ncbi:MAG: flagellar filament capping protein FliD, partial [Treponema sp.]|nr:flagellar filament capping protein FliD [Treponema sp.]
MSDVYIPGIRSRFNNEKVIEDLMKLERVPKERAEKNIERIEAEKGYWQEINNRTKSLRDSARNLFSFQNPFNDRIVRSSDESILTGTAVRDAIQQDRSFTVKQIAQADRFLSAPLADDFRVESGTYTFSVGNDEISFDFRGGTLREFTDVLNRRGRDKLQSSLVAVKSGTQSLLIESKITGEENRLGFAGAAIRLGEETGMIEQTNDSRRDFLASSLKVEAGSSVQIPMNLPTTGNLVLKFEVSTEPFPTEPWSPLPGPSIPGTGSVSYGGIVIESDNNSVTLPQQRTQPEKVDNMQILSLGFSDGSSLELSPISDSDEYITYQYELETIVSGKTIVFLNLINNNTHRDVSIQNVQVFDPVAMGGVKPLNAVSTAQDAVISMEGIEVRRSKNEINDLVPGLTITARGTSDRPIKLQIESDTEGVKDAIITFIGNYNRLMTEVNILTRSDERVINEITYLNREERESYKKQLGAFM